jgi:prepilin-type N-terminal cleavage/methylation domain-containing protein
MKTMTRGRKAFTLVELLTVVAVIGLLAALLLPAVQRAREAARRAQCQGSLRQLGIALTSYQTAAGVYPFGVGADGDGAGFTYTSPANRRFSMHSQMLPYLEQSVLFNGLNFFVPPFFPNQDGDPTGADGPGPNYTVAEVWVDAFVCPSDFDRMPSRPWGQLNYRSCNGSTWSGRVGDGMFGQTTRIGPANVRDGLSNTAAMSERIRGHDDYENVDVTTDQFRLAGLWTEATFTEWCATLSDAEAISLPKQPQNATAGMTWLEGNMSWTRYNHVLTPGHKTCINGVTWNGVIMTASSRHDGGVGLLLGDGSVRFVKETVSPDVWRALGTIAGGEAISGDAF